MNTTTTHTPVLDHFLATFRVQIAELEDRVVAERKSLPDFRKNEAADLALTDEEKERLSVLRLFAAAPELLEALKDAILCINPSGNPETFKCAQVTIAKAEGRE